MQVIEVLHYRRPEGRVPFQDWILALKDSDIRARINARIDRLMLGNFGDCKPVGASVFELRLHFGPGYRIYFGVDGNTLLLLLNGGTKKSQQEDIRLAEGRWKRYLEEILKSPAR